MSKAGAKFNPEKAKWFNQQYLQQKSDTDLTELFLPILEKELNAAAIKSEESENQISNFILNNNDYVTKVVSLIKERATFVSDLWNLSSFFFMGPTTFDEKVARKIWKPETGKLMSDLIELLDSIDDFSSQNIEPLVKEWITSKEIGFGKVMQPLRLSLVGALQGPNLFDVMGLIGKEETVSSIEKAIAKF